MLEDSSQPLISSDQPLKHPSEDELKRSRFCEEIARVLGRWRGHESLVVSLNGEWGAGKSTIKNFVRHYLGDQATVDEFNPWQWAGQDKLMEGLLWKLYGVFGKRDIAKQSKHLARKWKAFASIISLGSEVSKSVSANPAFLLLIISAFSSLAATAISAAPWLKYLGAACLALAAALPALGGAAEKLASAMDDWAAFNERSLEELRDEIEVELRKLDKPVVLFIDDIDRLTSDEIKLLIQLIKANLQFPNLIYFLLFQKSIVVNALNEITPDDGGRYLRKIVQVEFDVPEASEKQMQSILTRNLDAIISRDGVKLRWQKERWGELFLDDLWSYFKNLRDIKRFVASFEFYFTLHVNDGVLEVNPVDLIAIEVLRLFDQKTFLSVSKSFVGSQSGILGMLPRREELAKQYEDQIADIIKRPDIKPQEATRLRHLLQSLFPVPTGGVESNDWKRDFRICDKDFFYKYFQITIDPGKPAALEITRFIEVAGDRQQLQAILRDAIAKDTIEDFLDFVFVTRDDIPVECMSTVATALFDIGDNLPEARKSLFSMGLEMKCNRIIYQRLKNEPQPVATDSLWKAFTATTGFILPIHKLALEDRKTREKGQKEAFLISEDRLDEFLNLTLNRIRSKALDGTLLGNKSCGMVLYRWAEWSSDAEVVEWLQRMIQIPEQALKVLGHLTSKVIINGATEVPYINGQAVERWLDMSELFSAASATAVVSQNEKDRINLQLLQKSIQLKQEGKEYREVKLVDEW